MKVSDIFEGPYFIDQELKSSSIDDTIYSLDKLKNTNIELGSLTIDRKIYSFWIADDKSSALVTTDINTKHDNLIVASLTFHDLAYIIPVKKQLIVDTIFTHEKYQQQNLASALYTVLTKYGFSVISDDNHFRGGKKLWKSLAKRADSRKYKILIWSDKTRDWLRDENNKPIEYNASNLSDEQIWTDIKNYGDPTTLLVLQSV